MLLFPCEKKEWGVVCPLSFPCLRLLLPSCFLTACPLYCPVVCELSEACGLGGLLGDNANLTGAGGELLRRLDQRRVLELRREVGKNVNVERTLRRRRSEVLKHTAHDRRHGLALDGRVLGREGILFVSFMAACHCRIGRRTYGAHRRTTNVPEAGDC